MSKCCRICTVFLSFFITLLIISDYNNVVGLSRGGSRGGYRSSGTNVKTKVKIDSRYGGGSRGGGGYRSVGTNVKVKVKIDNKPRYGGGYRGVSYTRIGYSPGYSLWASRHSFSPNFRYRTSSYYYKSNGITMGLIFMSPRHRSTFIINRESSYNDISICYNEFPLYDRNISASPWFVCPWNDPRERYCCGDEIEEKCCAYTARSGSIAGIVVGILLVIIILISIIACCCCCRRRKRRTEMNMVIIDSGAVNKQEQANLIYPYPEQTNPNPPTGGYPGYPQPNLVSPPYPIINNNQPEPQVNYAPYPPANTFDQGYAPNPPANTFDQGYAPYPVYQTNPITYDKFNQQNPLAPPMNPPPTYSDVVRA